MILEKTCMYINLVGVLTGVSNIIFEVVKVKVDRMLLVIKDNCINKENGLILKLLWLGITLHVVWKPLICLQSKNGEDSLSMKLIIYSGTLVGCLVPYSFVGKIVVDRKEARFWDDVWLGIGGPMASGCHGLGLSEVEG
ncbi:hypothetical protein LXL04_038173 [Taraxacum kok-saghyz]